MSIHTLLRKYGIAPKKRLGQHFLVAAPTVEKIVAAVAPSPDDVVVEIGCGPGVLTGRLAARAGRVIAIERDERLLEIARLELAGASNIRWVHADVLGTSLEELLASERRAPAKVAGNLPYNISSPILFWLLAQRRLVSTAVLMLQKEVALRIAAAPGGKDYGILSVQVQAVAKVARLFDVSARSFLPEPAVASSVIRLDFTQGAALPEGIEERFRAVVRTAFGKRRKTLRNALLGASGLWGTAAALDAALALAKIDPRRRPETLSVEEFVKLASLLEAR